MKKSNQINPLDVVEKRKIIIFNQNGKGRKIEKIINARDLPKHLLKYEEFEKKGRQLPLYFLNELKQKHMLEIKDKIKAYKANKRKGVFQKMTAESFAEPLLFFIDIDFHSEQEEKIFKKEYKFYDDKKSLLENIEDFKIRFSNYSWISATSKNKDLKGLRFVVIVNYEYEEFGDYINDEEIEVDFVDYYKILYDKLTDFIFENFGLKNQKLIDSKMRSIHIGTSPCRLEGSIVKENPYYFDFTSDKDLIEKQHKKISLEKNNFKEYSKDETTGINKTFLENLSNDDYDFIFEKLKINEDFKNISSHRDPFYISTLEALNNDKLLDIFRIITKRNYQGNSLKNVLSNLQTFKQYIKNTGFGYNIPVKVFLEKIGIFIEKVNNENDLYGHKYDKEIKFHKWLDEKQNIVFDYFDFSLLSDKPKNLILKAETGTGKTTMILNLFKKLDGVKIFITSTNVNCQAVSNQAKKMGLNVYDYFDGNKELPFSSSNGVIITNISNLDSLKNEIYDYKLVVFDEVHKLIEYSIFEDLQSVRPLGNTIFLSATPGIFLFDFNEKYEYWNFKQAETPAKRGLTLVPCASTSARKKQLKKMMEVLSKQKKASKNALKWLEENRILIYINNKEEAETLKEKYSEFEFGLINANKKTDVYNTLMSDEILVKNVIVTSLINDGINIKNEKWKYVFYLDNMTQGVDNIYQFMSRFRIAKPLSYYLFQYSNDKTIEQFEPGESSGKDYFLNQLYQENKKYLEAVRILNDKEEENKNLDLIDMQYIAKHANTGVYELNQNKLSLDTWEKLMKNIRFNYFNLLRGLSYYFDISVKKYIKSDGTFEPKNNLEILEFFKKNIEAIEKNENGEFDIFNPERINLDDEIFRIKNQKRLDILTKRYNKYLNLKSLYDENNQTLEIEPFELINHTKAKFGNEIERLKVANIKEQKHIEKFGELTKLTRKEVDILERLIIENPNLNDFINAYNKERFYKFDSDEINNKFFRILGYQLKVEWINLKKHGKVVYEIIENKAGEKMKKAVKVKTDRILIKPLPKKRKTRLKLDELFYIERTLKSWPKSKVKS